MGNADRLRSRGAVLIRLALVTSMIPALLLAGCGTEPAPIPSASEASPDPEAIGFDGAPLYVSELPDDLRAERQNRLDEAREAWEAAPDDVDAIIWHGRRTAYLGHYREAVEIYTAGIARHPDDPRLYRHRGHRQISLRRLDEAIADLTKAGELAAGRPDEVEPDGLPNARNIPTSTLNSNIWYHLALAHYLAGDFEQAERAYRTCLEFSNNPDMLSATTHWLYMTLRRLGREADAAQILEPIDGEMDIIENVAYHDLLMMYKGVGTAEEVVPEGDSIESASAAYGVAIWHLVNGRDVEATEMLERIVAGSQWAAFGYIAAEADLARR